MNRAKEMFLQYCGNKFHMDRNGDLYKYNAFHISKETEEEWRKEYLSQFFEQKRYGRNALGSYSTAVVFLKGRKRDENWERFLYYPIRADWLDDVTVLFMLSDSFKLAEDRIRDGDFSRKEADDYLQALGEFIQAVQKRADAGTLTRSEDYIMQEFSDSIYVAKYLQDLLKDWTRLI